MTGTRILTGVSVILLILVLGSPQGEAATKTALSMVDRAVARVSPYVAEQAQERANALLQRLRDVTHQALMRGDALALPGEARSDTTT